MSIELHTPTDEVTGLPHPILPSNAANIARDKETAMDYHHHFFPRRAEELTPQICHDTNIVPELLCLEDIASLSLRISRGQLLPEKDHVLVHKKLGGPILPNKVQDKAIATIKACTGIVSRWAIDPYRPTTNMLVYMDDDTFKQVTNNRVLCTERAYYDRPANYRRRIFGNFLLKYALSQDITSVVSELVIEHFLDANEDGDAQRQHELGGLILKEALTAGVAPLFETHKTMRRLGLTQPGVTDLRKHVRKFIVPEIVPNYYPQLAQKLAA